MEIFTKNIKILRRYSGMYFPSETLLEATSFVAGMDMMQDEAIGSQFRDWLLNEKLKIESSFSWPGLVELIMKQENIDKEKQIEVFLSLVSEFLETKSKLPD